MPSCTSPLPLPPAGGPSSLMFSGVSPSCSVPSPPFVTMSSAPLAAMYRFPTCAGMLVPPVFAVHAQDASETRPASESLGFAFAVGQGVSASLHGVRSATGAPPPVVWHPPASARGRASPAVGGGAAAAPERTGCRTSCRGGRRTGSSTRRPPAARSSDCLRHRPRLDVRRGDRVVAVRDSFFALDTAPSCAADTGILVVECVSVSGTAGSA